MKIYPFFGTVTIVIAFSSVYSCVFGGKEGGQEQGKSLKSLMLPPTF